MDRREANHKWYSEFDAEKMTIMLREAADDGSDLIIPARYEVCETCGGKGKHVNPSIDAHGISREEFDEDPDFEEAYWRGYYDVRCNECGGEKVVPVVDEDRATPEQLKAVRQWQDDLINMNAEVEAERRMGA